MGSAQDDEEAGDFPELLLKVVQNPSLGRRWLPHLLGFFESDDVRHRLTASWAVSMVAVTDEEMLEYAVRRLVDRLDEDSPVEVRHTLDYLAARDPRTVDEVLVDLEDESEVRARRLMYQTGGGFARNESVPGSETDRVEGRARVAGESGDSDPRRIYEEEDGDETGEHEDDGDGDEYGRAGDESDGEGASHDESRLTRDRIDHVADHLSRIAANSRFDDLNVLSDRDRRRYADVYRTAGTVGNAQEAVALTLFPLPDRDREAFLGEFDSAMDRWSDVDDHGAVLTVHDWGTSPHPWAATEYTDLTLADRGRLDPAAAIRNGCRLANALAHSHQRGVVHAALDPENVVYYGTALAEEDDREPLLTNVGLTSFYRNYVAPESVLDPRYAAPEYYDAEFGGIDHATDVYGLGVVLYRLCTGRHPFTGTFEAVREQVLSEPVPAPSTVADVPEELDQVVGKATAKRKLRRYETVNHFQRELRTIGGADAG